jgi:hypothetical protein
MRSHSVCVSVLSINFRNLEPTCNTCSVPEVHLSGANPVNFENCVHNKLLQFDFKAIYLTDEMKYFFFLSPSPESHESWHGYIFILDHVNVA